MHKYKPRHKKKVAPDPIKAMAEFREKWPVYRDALKAQHRNRFPNVQTWIGFKKRMKAKFRKSFTRGFPHPNPKNA